MSWQEVELGNACHFENGDRGKNYPSQSAFIDVGIPFISAKDLDNNLINQDELKYISEETYNRLSSGKLKPNDILFCLRGSLGKFAINKDGLKGGIASSLVLIRAKDNLEINYLKHYLNSPKIKRLIEKSDNGSSQPNLSGKNVKKFPISLPPLDQQKKIAAILDAADVYRQKTKALIEKYDELTQSLFLDMFGDPVTNPKGWEEVKLGSICDVGSSKRVFVEELVEAGIPFYRGTEVGKLGEGMPIIPKLFITNEHYEKLKQYRGVPKKGDLLMPSICPDGRIWVVNDDDQFYFKDGRVLWVEVDSNKINSIYLRYHLKGSFLANYNNIASGTTFAELKIVALKKMNIFYPDLRLQNHFAERVQAIEEQKTQAEASLAQAEDLFNSLLQRAFKGELTT